jgi:hypothetical protein
MTDDDDDLVYWRVGDDFDGPMRKARAAVDAAGEQIDAALRVLSEELEQVVNSNVKQALFDYLGEASFAIDYRVGGSPIISLTGVYHDFNAPMPKLISRDLGDVLFALCHGWEEEQPDHPMADLARALLAAYHEWRAQRIADDRYARIPEPAIDEDGEPVKREPIPADYREHEKEG